MNDLPEAEIGDKEHIVQGILVRAAYYRAVDWFCVNTGRTPEVDEQAMMVCAIVRCVTMPRAARDVRLIEV